MNACSFEQGTGPCLCVMSPQQPAAHLLQPPAESHLAQVVGQEAAWAVGGIACIEKPAEDGHVSSLLHGGVELHGPAQHEELQGFQQAQLLLPSLEHTLTQTQSLLRTGAAHRRLPLGTTTHTHTRHILSTSPWLEIIYCMYIELLLFSQPQFTQSQHFMAYLAIRDFSVSQLSP